MNPKNERGLSLVEMMITVAILGTLIGIIGHFFFQEQDNMIDTENRTDLAVISQTVALNLRTSVLENYRLLCDMTDADGPSATFTDYYQDISAGIQASTTSSSQAPTAVSWIQEPVYEPNYNEVTGSASPNPMTSPVNKFGDALVFIAAISPVVLTGITDNAGATATPAYTAAQMPMSDVRLDRYQFVAIYLCKDPTRNVINVSGNHQSALRLVEWRSKPYVDFTELDNMDVTGTASAGGTQGEHLTNTVKALIALGYDYAFNPAENEANEAFFPLSVNPVNPIILTPETMTMIPEQSWAYVDEFNDTQDPNPLPLSPKHRVVAITHRGGVSGFPSGYSIAYNVYNPSGGVGTRSTYMINQILGGMQGTIPVPLLATPSTTSPFPAGFEVGVVASTEVWMRIAFIASSGARSANSVDQEYTGAEGVVDVSVTNH